MRSQYRDKRKLPQREVPEVFGLLRKWMHVTKEVHPDYQDWSDDNMKLNLLGLKIDPEHRILEFYREGIMERWARRALWNDPKASPIYKNNMETRLFRAAWEEHHEILRLAIYVAG